MNDQNFDELLDGILQEDGQAEPIAGLEGRILTRLASMPERRFSWRFVAWGLGAAIPACLALAFALSHHSKPPVELPMLAQHQSEPSPQVAVDSAKPAVISARRDTKRAPVPVAVPATEQAEELPKLDVFPTPRAPEEPLREPVTIAQDNHTPAPPLDQAGKAIVKVVVEPITIAAIEIAPIFPPPEPAKPKSPKEIK